MIEVEDFIRTNTGTFDKVINNNYYMPQYIECEKGIVDKENIVKHSKNIIDLVEIGDIVNNYIVLDVMEDLQTGEIHLEMPSSYPKDGSCAIYNDEIETILTKQQYTQNCYKIDTN